jgi:hypothetical protein
MRVLLIDDTARASVQRVLDFAMLPDNWYFPGRSSDIPGNDPRFVAHLRYGFRCVFTVTKAPDGFVFRHLTISVDSDKYPNVAAACAIAEMFGFSGWDGKTMDRLPATWMANVNKKEHCIVLAQPYEDARATA